MAETVAVVALAAADHVRVSSAAQQLLDPAFAPTEPLLAGALLVRAAAMAATAGGDEAAAQYRRQARDLYVHALANGATLASIRNQRGLAAQWEDPAFLAFWQELEAEGK